MADSINKQLQHLIITHSVYVEKYKTYESNKMLKILEAADDDLTAQLAKHKGTIASERRLRKQLEAIKAIEESYASVFYDEYKGDLKAFAGNEGGWYVERLRELTSPYVNLDFTLPSAAQIYSAAEASFLILDKGVTLDLESMINSVFGTRSQIIEQTLRQGFVLGKTNQQIVKELMGYEEAGAFFDGNMKKARTSMERIVRTSMSHLASTARDEVYSRNDDIVKGYKIAATLDSRTCFTKGHNISTPSGVKDISEIVSGDIIYNGKMKAVEVIKTKNSTSKELIEIKLENGKTIRCTPDHLLLTVKGEWIEAQNLTSGMDLKEEI